MKNNYLFIQILQKNHKIIFYFYNYYVFRGLIKIKPFVSDK